MKKYIKNTLGVTLLLISINAFSSNESEKEDLYDIATKLSVCSGNFEFSSLINKSLGNEATSKSLHEFSNGWLLAGYANYFFSGLTHEMAKSSSDGNKETTLTYWLAKLEGTDKDEKKIIKLIDSLASKIKICTLYEDLVVYSQKQIKMHISEASKL